ncbi:MAG: hypothetical protein VW239_00250 [Candidatus Nanopelagicales bacterium]
MSDDTTTATDSAAEPLTIDKLNAIIEELGPPPRRVLVSDYVPSGTVINMAQCPTCQGNGRVPQGSITVGGGGIRFGFVDPIPVPLLGGTCRECSGTGEGPIVVARTDAIAVERAREIVRLSKEGKDE